MKYRYAYAGTCFFIIKEANNKQGTFVITAKHVLEKVKDKFAVDELFIKVNLNDRTTLLVKTKMDDWIRHKDENVDLAMCKLSFMGSYDHMFYPMSSFMNDELITQYEIGVGDEVLITGLFHHHPGNDRNSPIVRIGNISLMPQEKVLVENRLREAYLIESRSIGGLSGSPVFVNLGDIRKFGTQIKYAQGEHIPILFGIICGHFDTKKREIDAISDSTDEQKQINVGIAVVTPVNKLVELLHQSA